MLSLPLLIGAVAVAAAPIPVIENGSLAPAAEVCWFAGAPLPSGPLQCQPAGSLAPGDGAATVFARHPPDAVSIPRARKDAQSLTLVTAGTLETNVPPGEQFAYMPGSAAMIAGPLVPADMPMIPVQIHDAQIVRIGLPVTVAAREHARAQLRLPPPDRVDLILPVVNEVAIRRDVPEVLVIGAGREYRPLVDVHRDQGTWLAIFRGIPTTAKVILRGSGWKTVERTLTDLAPGRVITLREPLLAAPSRQLLVRWSAAHDLVALRRDGDAECSHALHDPWRLERSMKPFHLALYRCPGRPIVREQCTLVATRDLNEKNRAGEETFDDLDSGLYSVRLLPPQLPAVTSEIEVTGDARAVLDVDVRYYRFFGRVTRNGDPVRARLFGTISDEAGNYEAVLPVPFTRRIEVVSPCDGRPSYRAFLDPPPRENEPFNINMPERHVVARVVDKDTGQPLEKAVVQYTMRSGKDERVGFSDRAGMTDDHGTLRIDHVAANATITVCAAYPEYERSCTDPFELLSDEREVDLALTRLRKYAGRVHVDGAINSGDLWWFTPAGQLLERVPVRPDGTFSYNQKHAPGELLIFLSASHPLFASIEQSPTNDDRFDIAVPVAPARVLSLSRHKDAMAQPLYFTISVNDLVVPLQAFAAYLLKHSIGEPVLLPTWTRSLPPILATGPLHVLFAIGTPGNAATVGWKRVPVGTLRELQLPE